MHELAASHHGDPIAEPQRLVHVMGDEDDGLLRLGLDAADFALQRLAGRRVERAEGLVHEHDVRVGRERARDADALLLAARELVRELRAEFAGIEPQEMQQLVDARLDPRPSASASRRGTVAMLSATFQCGKRPIDWIT